MDGGGQSGGGGPLAIFGDFGFVGGQDVAPDPLQNAQICINWYPEVDQDNAKEVVALLGCPGLNPLVSAPGGGPPGYTVTQTAWPVPSTLNLPVRGMYELPNGTAIVVIANTAYLMTAATGATAVNFPTFALTSIGTLLTSSGPVCIVDNNGGGLPYTVSGTTVQLAVIVDGQYGYSYNYGTNTFAQITDPEFYGADRVVCIDGWFVFNLPNTQVFYTPISPYSLTFSGAGNGVFVALKDAAPDNLVTIGACKEQLWLIGDRTTEIWYDAGGANFAFSRMVGTLIQAGCKAKHSISRFSADGQDGLIWFGRSERGENVICLTRGFSIAVVSNPGFGDEVATYPITNDAIGYTYQEDTHEFYVLTFPTADVTWCYDSQSGLLHKRLSYDPYADQYHRHRSNCFMNFQGMRMVGDYQTGTVHQLTRSAYTDAGWPIKGQRRAPHIWDKAARGRVFMGSLQVDFLPGVGQSVSSYPVYPSGTIQGGAYAPGTGTFGQIYEVAISNPIFATTATQTSSTALWPVITGIAASGVSVVDRVNYATTFAALKGDGNSYNYSLTTGALSSTTTETTLQNAWAARSQGSVSPSTATGLGFSLSASGNGGFGISGGYTLLNYFGSSANGNASNSFCYSVLVSGYSSGSPVFIVDALPALQNVPANFFLRAVYPSADGQHAVYFTANASNTAPYVWNIVKFSGGTATSIANGTGLNSYIPTVGPGSGDFNDSNPDSNLEYKAILDSDNQTLWIQTTGGVGVSGAQILQLSGGTVTLLQTISNLFPAHSGLSGPGALFAFGGYLAAIKSNILTVWYTPTVSANVLANNPVQFNSVEAANPQAYLSISRDGGQTFGQKWPAPMGAIGNTRNRTMWRRLGFARDSVVDLQVIDPVRRDIVGATLRAFSS